MHWALRSGLVVRSLVVVTAASVVPAWAQSTFPVPTLAVPTLAVPTLAVPTLAVPTLPEQRDEVATNDTPSPSRISRRIGDLGVEYLVWGGKAEDIAAAVDASVQEGLRVLAHFSTDGMSRPLARINAAAGHEAVDVDSEVFDVLMTLRRVAQLSHGAYDFTAAIYDDAWRFDDPLHAKQALPTRAELSSRRRFVSFEDVVLDPITGRVKVKKDGARLDVSGVIKGHMLSRMRTTMHAHGIVHFVLSAGGDVVVSGQRGERPWRIGVQDPRGPQPFLALPLDPERLGGAVMTVSDNENFFVVGDSRYHSVLDPRTGLPSTKARSVTVFFDDPLVAEALARAVFVLGEREGLSLVERHKGAQVVVVTGDNRVVLSRGLSAWAAAEVLHYRAPTDGP